MRGRRSIRKNDRGKHEKERWDMKEKKKKRKRKRGRFKEVATSRTSRTQLHTVTCVILM